MLETTILAALHIFFAIAWLGGGIMFGLVIAPMLAKLSPTSSGEFFLKIGPRVIRFFQVIPLLTVVFGFGLMASMVHDGGYSYGTSTAWGVEITAGLTVAVVALVVSEAFAVPPLGKIVRLIREMEASESHVPSPELPKTVAQAGRMALVMLTLLLITLGFMVSAGFY